MSAPSLRLSHNQSVAALMLAAMALPALAHSDVGAAGGFLAGLGHPVSGLDHVLAMIAVGLWGAQLGNPAMWVLPVAFPLVMAFGGFLGLIGIALPGVEVGIAVSALVLGTAVLMRARPALPLAAVLVACFSIFHGHAHGTELPDGADGLTYSAGFVIATGLLHAAGIALGYLQHLPSGASIVRALGGFVLVGGLGFLYRALAG